MQELLNNDNFTSVSIIIIGLLTTSSIVIYLLAIRFLWYTCFFHHGCLEIVHLLIVLTLVIRMVSLVLITIRWRVLISLLFIFKWLTHACSSKICHLTHRILNSFLFIFIVTLSHQDVNILECLLNRFLLLLLDHLLPLFLLVSFRFLFLLLIVMYLLVWLLFFFIYQLPCGSCSTSRFRHFFLNFFRLRFRRLFWKIFLGFLDWFLLFDRLWFWFFFFEAFEIDDD